MTPQVGALGYRMTLWSREPTGDGLRSSATGRVQWAGALGQQHHRPAQSKPRRMASLAVLGMELRRSIPDHCMVRSVLNTVEQLGGERGAILAGSVHLRGTQCSNFRDRALHLAADNPR